MKRDLPTLIRVTALQTMLAQDDHDRFQPFGGPYARRADRTLARYRALLWKLVTDNGRKTRDDLDWWRRRA